ncbi:hypothetical protein SAMN05421755_10909 [Nitrosomonas sp. Nm33]|nr:hypothetical protein SAMN05421755_10909 [Nitrosomonas sp. Nm33]
MLVSEREKKPDKISNKINTTSNIGNGMSSKWLYPRDFPQSKRKNNFGPILTYELVSVAGKHILLKNKKVFYLFNLFL